MIYSVLKQIVNICLFVFFKKVVVSGQENIPSNGPLILAANHPNTFMDPLLIAVIANQRIGFIGNGGIFQWAIMRKFLAFFHVIPIYRKQDLKPGQKADHQKTFKSCHEYLNSGGTILIFPEGSSIYELNLREIKTGTARIVLSMEGLHNFNSGLKITPVTLSYSDAIQFRSTVSIRILPPILVSDYKEAFNTSEERSVRLLTEDIRTQLAQYVAETSGKPQELFLIRSHKFFGAYHDPASKWYVNPKRSFKARNNLSKSLQELKQSDPKLYHQIELQIGQFFYLLDSEKLSMGFFSTGFLNSNKWFSLLAMILLFILLLPVYLYGLITNYLPYRLPRFIFTILNLDIEYKAPVQMIAGLLCFPLFYLAEILLFMHFISKEWILTLLFSLSLPLSGYVAMYCWLLFKRIQRMIRFQFKVSRAKKNEIISLRDQLLSYLEN